MWIDRVTDLEPGKRLVAIKHVSLAEEHLHDHFPADERGDALPVMPASLILEGCAQSAGILVGHAEGFREKVILAKVNQAELSREATPGCTLRYTAEIVQMDKSGASTSCRVELIEPVGTGSRTEVIGAVTMMFSHIDNNMQGVKFPEHNFVFGEGFKTLLRTSGVAWTG